MGNKENVYGEGNYDASRKYNDATKQFVQSGKVGKAARDAEPATEADALQMAAAEAEGKRRAKEEDPALARKDGKTNIPAQPDSKRSETAPEEPVAPQPGNEE
jgi:hypothetical protein